MASWPSMLAARPPARALAWVERALGRGTRVCRVRALPGAFAAAVHALDVEDRHGRGRRLVLRRFVRRDWLAREPDLAGREARTLRRAAALPFPTPEILALDARGTGCDVPALLLGWLPGRVDLQPEALADRLEALAGVLPVLHALPTDAGVRPFRSYRDPRRLALPAWSRRPGVWRRALDALALPPPSGADVFLHRDYHPGNVLFRRGRLAGVLDWTNACRGPAGVDLGHCRLNLALLGGVRLADRFLACYRRAAGGEPDPWFDLLMVANLDPGPPDAGYWRAVGRPDLGPARLRERLDAYVASVVARLGPG